MNVTHLLGNVARSPNATPATIRSGRHLWPLLQLALGRPSIAAADDEWPMLLAGAHRERVLTLAWHRSRALIRAAAPAPVAESWYKAAVRAGLVAREQFELLCQSVAALEDHGLSPIVLKGPPLSYHLYGDACVRPAADLDLYVPERERSYAEVVLTAAGWEHVAGESPAEQTFSRPMAHGRGLLEVHSTLLDDPLMGHLRLPISDCRALIGTAQLPVYFGTLLPAFLSAHLAKHRVPPLLWVVDLCTLFAQHSAAELSTARAAAFAVGLERHLAWGEQLAATASRVADGDARALGELERASCLTGEMARVWRLVRLSSNARDALSVVGGRLLPPAERRGWRTAPARAYHRGSRWIARRFRETRNRRVPPSAVVRSSLANGRFVEPRTYPADSLGDREVPPVTSRPS